MLLFDKSVIRAAAVTLSALLLVPFPASAEESAPGEKRIVLSIGDTTTRSGWHYNENLGMWQYLADLLGVEIEYIYMPPEEYAAGLASGNLPDIVATHNDLSTIRENGVALNAAPYLEEYVPNLLKGDAKITCEVFEQLEDDGGFYFFPAKIGYNGVGFDNETSTRGYVLRWDYYKELGYPPVNNEDDYLNVLMQMHENHPFTEEGLPTYLYGTDSFSGYDTAFRSELSLDYWVAYKYQNNIFTNEIYDGYTDTAHSMWWAVMEWENRLYRAGKEDGSYDMELFTQSKAQFDAKTMRGQYLGRHSASGDLYREKVSADPDTLSGYCIVPTAATNYYTNVYQLLGNGSAYMWFISANSPHKEEALKLFNYMCDPDFVRELTLGRKGETWYYDEDGVPRMNEYGQEQLDAYNAGSTDPDNYYVKWGSFDKTPSNWTMLRDNSLHPDGYPVDFATITREYEMNTMSNNIARDICEHYGVELPTDAVYNAGGLDFRNDCGEAISSCMSSLNRDQLHILAEAEKILQEVQVDLILAETDEQFQSIRDETIRKLTELGEPEVFKAYQKKWDEAAEIIVPLVREVQIRNGIEPYTPDDYADRIPEETEEQQIPAERVSSQASDDRISDGAEVQQP